MGHVGSSKDGSKAAMAIDDDDIMATNDDDMDIDPDEYSNEEILKEVGDAQVVKYCEIFSKLFFEQYGLISHQINSYNQFISTGIQSIFDSFGDLVVTPGFDPSKKGDGDNYRYASVKFRTVTLDRPKFWCGEGSTQEFKMLPRHARLQRMTYASKMKVNVHVQV